MRLGTVTLVNTGELPNGDFRYDEIKTLPLGEVEPSGGYDKTDVQAVACGCDDGEGCDFMCRYDRAGKFLYCPECLQGYLQIV